MRTYTQIDNIHALKHQPMQMKPMHAAITVIIIITIIFKTKTRMNHHNSTAALNVVVEAVVQL